MSLIMDREGKVNPLADDTKGPTYKARIPLRVALFTNYIAPYTRPVWLELSSSLESLQLVLSTAMEPRRERDVCWHGLNVAMQRCLTTSARRRSDGFTDQIPIHIPYDTIPLLRRLRPDVVISAQLGFRTLQAAIYRLFSHSRSRLVIWADLSEHTEREIGAIRTLARRLLLRAADAVVVNGASGTKYIMRLGVPRERIVQAPYTTDMSPLMSIPLTRDPCAARRLLYIGRLIEIKGLDVFLRGLACWVEKHPEQTCEMWLVGDGPLRKKLERFPLPPRLSLNFFGNVPYGQLSHYLSQAGVLVLPTLQDTWGLVVNEALAAGVPVLGSLYSQAVNELVQDGINGWVFQPNDPENTQDALSRAFATSSERLSQMRRAARASISHFTPALGASRFLEAIRVSLNKVPIPTSGCIATPAYARSVQIKSKPESGK